MGKKETIIMSSKDNVKKIIISKYPLENFTFCITSQRREISTN